MRSGPAPGCTEARSAQYAFEPRGHTSGMFAGGLAGGGAGSVLGGAAEAVGAEMLIGVSDTTVYGFAGPTRHSEPTALAFRVSRAGLTAKVHQR